LSSHGLLDLAVPEFLTCGDIRFRSFAGELGIEVPPECHATVRRLDAAVDIAFVEPSEGLAYLAALSSLDLPCVKRTTSFAKGSSVVQSVSWSNRSSGIVVRAYDKLTELRERARRPDAGPAGALIRLERQWRLPASMNRVPEALVGCLVRSAEFAQQLSTEFGRYFGSWALERLVVSGPLAAYYHLKDRVGTVIGRKRDGSPHVLTERLAERMMGTLIALYQEGDEGFRNRRIARERRAELRRVGIVVSDFAGRVIEIGRLIGMALAAWRDLVCSRQMLVRAEAA
jgi:hypothetical protein